MVCSERRTGASEWSARIKTCGVAFVFILAHFANEELHLSTSILARMCWPAHPEAFVCVINLVRPEHPGSRRKGSNIAHANADEQSRIAVLLQLGRRNILPRELPGGRVCSPAMLSRGHRVIAFSGFRALIPSLQTQVILRQSLPAGIQRCRGSTPIPNRHFERNMLRRSSSLGVTVWLAPGGRSPPPNSCEIPPIDGS